MGAWFKKKTKTKNQNKTIQTKAPKEKTAIGLMSCNGTHYRSPILDTANWSKNTEPRRTALTPTVTRRSLRGTRFQHEYGRTSGCKEVPVPVSPSLMWCCLGQERTERTPRVAGWRVLGVEV